MVGADELVIAQHLDDNNCSTVKHATHQLVKRARIHTVMGNRQSVFDDVDDVQRMDTGNHQGDVPVGGSAPISRHPSPAHVPAAPSTSRPMVTPQHTPVRQPWSTRHTSHAETNGHAASNHGTPVSRARRHRESRGNSPLVAQPTTSTASATHGHLVMPAHISTPSSVTASPSGGIRAGARHHPYRRLQTPSMSIAADDDLVRPYRLDMLLNRPLPSMETMMAHAWNADDRSLNMFVKDDDPFTLHRHPVAQSTDCVRGKRAYTRGLHVWEITW